MARNIEDIEKEITQLPDEQLRKFRACYLFFKTLGKLFVHFRASLV